MLVVAGGGQLDEEWGGSWGHPYALMKWAVLARVAGAVDSFSKCGRMPYGFVANQAVSEDRVVTGLPSFLSG